MELLFLLFVVLFFYGLYRGISHVVTACRDYNYYKKETEKLEKSLMNKNYEIGDLKKQCSQLYSILHSTSPFSIVSEMYSDVELAVYGETESYLRHKSHPARSAAEEVKNMRLKTREYISQYRVMLYKYNFLIKTFPELKSYIDDEDSLLLLGENCGYSDFQENRDKSKDYLSTEEWNNLDVDDRNQLALDRYKKRNKSNWVIGIEYEMYIDYVLRTAGFKTIPYGSMKGLEDLGRDIIAFKPDNKGNTVTYIIQCKNWSNQKEKLIHENVVCQIFGTALEYQIKHKNEMFLKVVPVIYSTVPFSETAVEFGRRLGVIMRIVEKREYPMIKCNISNDGNKIYHLPFDQQYYRTEICKSGEFYAWTVREAVDNGFRRAFKYNKNR